MGYARTASPLTDAALAAATCHADIAGDLYAVTPVVGPS